MLLRRLLLLVALVLILAVVVALTRAAPRWHYVHSGQPGDLLYVATFDGFLEDWQQYDDGHVAAQVEGSALRLTLRETEKIPYSLAEPHFGDFDLRLDARAVEGPLNNGYGVILRFQDAASAGSAPSWGALLADRLDRLLNVPVDVSYYMFLVSSDGYYQVRRRVNGVDRIISNWIPSPIVRQGFDDANHLRVIADGPRFTFFVNGEQVPLCIPNDPNGISTYALDSCIQGTMQDALVDDSIASGQIGVVAQSFNEPGVVVDFDNLLVYAPAS